MQASMAVVKILRENLQHSAFREEVESHGGAYQVEAWYSRYVKVLATRFEEQGMLHVVRTWRRWLRWRAGQASALPDHPAAPAAVNMATWMEDEGARGRTVQRGLHNGLRWLRAHAGFESLPLKSPLIRDVGGAMGKLV
jgi:hypothetical protein